VTEQLLADAKRVGKAAMEELAADRHFNSARVIGHRLMTDYAR
jgi:hypothetical protein